jgi:hypothetical protein
MPTHTTVNASNLVEASFDVSSPSSSQQLALLEAGQGAKSDGDPKWGSVLIPVGHAACAANTDGPAKTHPSNEPRLLRAAGQGAAHPFDLTRRAIRPTNGFDSPPQFMSYGLKSEQ